MPPNRSALTTAFNDEKFWIVNVLCVHAMWFRREDA